MTGEVRNYNIATSYDGQNTIATYNSGMSHGPASGHIAVGYGNYVSYDDIENATEAIKNMPEDVKDELQNTLDYALQEGYRSIMSHIR